MIIKKYYDDYSKLMRKYQFIPIYKIKGIIYYLSSFLLTRKIISYTKTNKEKIVTNYINKTNDNNVLVSLTSYGDRILTVHLTIFSILLQSVKPKKIILWIYFDDEEIVKNNLLLGYFEKEGVLEIRYCEDLKSHKKYFYTMKENPENSVLTIDDDVFYPENFIYEILSLYSENPKNICCTKARKMIYKNGFFQEYDTWEEEKEKVKSSLLLCPIGVGGVLYPTGSLDSRVFNKDEIFKTSIHADDLWLKTMSILNRTNVSKTNIFPYNFLAITNTQATALGKKNVTEKKNDIQLDNIVKIYGTELNKIINEVE